MENVEDKNKKNALLQHTPKISIQEAFKKFQKQKFYQLKLNKYLQKIEVDRKSPQFKNELRQKFIETAHKYIGVPYSKKYHNPGDILFDAPLFLDCCGLIRQIIFDLRQQFGYTIAKWNQSYQFDLLPNQNLTENDLKPGDLIFYSAIYNNTKMKPFPHGMVHVEIYLGEGKSIGSRWQKGTIQTFNSYKFQSTHYHHIQFHYRSIDYWLQGTFQSHCTEHKWLDDRANQWLSDKFSVFADPSLDDLNIKEWKIKDIRNIFIGKGNNCKLVHNYFGDTEKYSIMGEKEQFSPHFFFKWVQSTGQIDFYSFKEGTQIVNHIPNICVISSKLQLLKTLKDNEMYLVSNKKALTLKMQQFIPKTYRLDVMSDEIEFLNDDSSGIWIYKPRNLNQGRGIRMIGQISQFKKEFISSKRFYLGEFSLNNMMYYKPQLNPTTNPIYQQSQRYSQLNHDGLIQHYIQPLLIKNKKFDIRCYLFINSSPNIVLFHPGYLRLTIQQYSQENVEDQHNLMVHLTNNCFQNKHPLYKQKKEETIGNWDLMVQEIGHQAVSHLKHKIKRIMLVVYAAARKKLMAQRGTYELLGCDIIVRKDLKPYLLEVNTNPAMFTDTKVQKQMLPTLMKNTLDIALALYQSKSSAHIFNNLSTYNFEPIYCEQTKFIYNSENQTCDESKQINGLKLQTQVEVCEQCLQCKTSNI